ncbi:MAG: M48 family metalloprotease [Saprospiraceae bacterium]|nr:M48 family metalloprotease [Saprospiraceae bacterium]
MQKPICQANPGPSWSRLLIWGICFLPQLTGAQNSVDPAYQPANTLAETLPETLSKINTRLEADLAALPKPNKKFLAKEYKERADSLKSELLQGSFLMDDRWNPWFQNILEEILRHNPDVAARDITLLLSRYESPNARCVGEGTLVFNIGLLPFLENESQVAFILCHELAHYHNNHGNQALHQYINTLYSPEMQKQLKEISRGTYNKTERALELMKGMAYNGRRHSRFKESEADSLGFVFFSRTGYQLKEAVGALQILDSIDKSHWPRIPYDSLFQSKGFPFQNSWLEQKGLGGGFSTQATQPSSSTEFNEDSLKTHPDCPERIKLTQAQVEALGKDTGKAFLQDETQFHTMQQKTPYELVEGLYQTGHYGRSLFRALVMLTKKRDDAYLNAMVVKNLYEICQYQRNHRMRHVVDLPDPEYSAEYNRFLKFINQFRTSEFQQLTYHFYLERWEKYKHTEDFMFAAVLATSLKPENPDFQSRLDEYLTTYPKGKYLDHIKAMKD